MLVQLTIDAEQRRHNIRTSLVCRRRSLLAFSGSGFPEASWSLPCVTSAGLLTTWAMLPGHGGGTANLDGLERCEHDSILAD